MGRCARACLLAGCVSAAAVGAAAPPRSGFPEVQTVGREQSLRVDPDLGRAERLAERWRWRQRVALPGASFVRLHFTEFALAAGDALTLVAAGRTVERLTGRGPGGRGEFWALTAFADELELELDFAAPYGRLPFRVDRALAGDPGWFDGGLAAPASVCGGADFEDAACYAADAGTWSNVRASAGVLGVGGDPATAIFCSAVNVSPFDYVLTNYHCLPGVTSCADAEFVFGYRRELCGAPPLAGNWRSFRCGEIVAASPEGSCETPLDALDFSLSSVEGDPSAQFGYARPEAGALADGTPIYIVQHAAGRPQEIVHGAGADVDVDTAGGTRSVLRYYGSLDTEAGSSGAGVFRAADGGLVALHRCGGCALPGVGNRGVLMSDIFPQIFDFLCLPTSLRLEPRAAPPLAEVEGNGDAALDPGERWRFAPVVRNRACALDAAGVIAWLELSPDSVTPLDLAPALAVFGDVAAGSDREAGAPTVVRLDPELACGGRVRVDVGFVAGAGTPIFPGRADLIDAPVGAPVPAGGQGDAVCHPWAPGQVFTDDFETADASRWDGLAP